ncbi:unnamed protein product [Peniophora sp. CBMAI 1063]|nr:unnamed protein product [Peniophora sp. CBMAI 1063]
MLDMPVPISPFDVPLTPILDITSPRPPSSDSTPSISTIINHAHPEPWPMPPITRPGALRVDCGEQSSKVKLGEGDEIAPREMLGLPPVRTSAPGPIVSLSSDTMSPPVLRRAQSFHFVDEENKPHTLRRRRGQMFGSESTSEEPEPRAHHARPVGGVDAKELMKLLKIKIPEREVRTPGGGGSEEGMKMLRRTVEQNEFDIQFLGSVIILLCVLLAGLVALLAAEA